MSKTKMKPVYDKISVPENSYIFSCGDEIGNNGLYVGKQHILVAVPDTYKHNPKIKINGKCPFNITPLLCGTNDDLFTLNNYIFYEILNVAPNPNEIQFSNFDDIFHISIHPLYFINFTKDFKLYSITKIIKINHQYDVEYNTVILNDFFEYDYLINTIKTHQHGYYEDIIINTHTDDMSMMSSRQIEPIYGEKLYQYCINTVLDIENNNKFDLNWYYNKYNDIKKIMKGTTYDTNKIADLFNELNDALKRAEIIPIIK